MCIHMYIGIVKMYMAICGINEDKGHSIERERGRKRKVEWISLVEFYQNIFRTDVHGLCKIQGKQT